MDRRRSTLALWTVFGLLMMCIAAWPVWRGMIVMNDDMKFLRSAGCDLPLADQLRLAWSGSPSFRPMEIVVGRLCDPITLACPWVMPVQMAGMLVLAWAVTRLASMVMPGERRLAPLAMILVALSPATTCAVWQMDACSQTWSAALGLWACVHAWRGAEQVSADGSPWPSALWLLGIFTLLLTVKETAYGWSLGIGTALLIWAFLRWRSSRRTPISFVPLLLPTIALPVVHLIVRVSMSAASNALHGDEETRYQLSLGVNTLVSLLVSVAASCTTGPLHWLGDASLPIGWRLTLLLPPLLVVCLLASLAERAWSNPGSEDRRIAIRSLSLTLVSCGSLIATAMLQTSSELYGLGTNAPCSLMLAVATLLLLNSHGTPRLLGFAAVSATSLFIAVGAMGLVDRARLFSLMWRSTSTANDLLLRSLAAIPSGSPRTVSLVFAHECRPAFSFGQYEIPLQQSMGILWTMDWAERRQPGLRLELLMDTPCSEVGSEAVCFTCPWGR